MEKISERVQQDIKERAESYTPEWKFDIQSPDIGTALALIYAKMMEGTKRRFGKVWEKNKLAFLNELNACLLPAVPSHGYVQFLLVNEEVEGAEVAAGTEVLADDNTLPGGRVLFETREDIFVTPAVLSDIYLACDQYDMICEHYDRRKGDWKPFRMFVPQKPNLQKHELYFSHDTLLNVQTEAQIETAWIGPGNRMISQELLRALGNQEKAVFEYYSEKGWTELPVLEVGQDGLVFKKEKEKPGFVKTDIAGWESYWMRCRLLKFKEFAGIYLEGIRLSTGNRGMLPDAVFGAQAECNVQRCFPFGERLDLYQEVYFGSQEVLSKKGAQITLTFGLDFVKIPLETNQEKAFQREWVMKQSDFKPDWEFEVTIEDVIWEYFNGSGWTRLFAEGKHGRIFSGTEGGYRTISFTCPGDMERILVNAVDTYYIRARITKINNLYKLNGHFVIPIMENIAFRYSYQEDRPWVQRYLFRNNRESRLVKGGPVAGQQTCKPFVQTGLEGMGLYFGFEVPPIGTPVKILFEIANDADRSDRHLLWEYWNGTRWKHLSMADETENFSRTGLVTFTGSPDMAGRRLFGKERYWLRVCGADYVDIRDNTLLNFHPVLQKVCMNTTAVQNFHRRVSELFRMEAYQEGKRFSLQDENVYEAEVYVDEQGYLTQEEIAKLSQEREIQIEEGRDYADEGAGVWVRWEQVHDFAQSQSLDRHFVLNEAEGSIGFGDGVHGRVPYVSQHENILVRYRCGGGAYTNLEKGRVDRLGTHIGYISQVTNPGAMAGGCDAESVSEAVGRTCASIRHQGRAVCARDYEELAMCASRQLLTAKCFAGFDNQGERTPGAVTLVVLPKQFQQEQIHFAELRERIVQYMDERISHSMTGGHRLSVILPELIEVCLFIEILAENYSQIFHIRREVVRRLEEFFQPAALREGGREIGSFPETAQIHNAVNDIKGIEQIQKIVMSAYKAGTGGRQEEDLEKVRRRRYVLPVSGSHNIVVKVAGKTHGR